MPVSNRRVKQHFSRVSFRRTYGVSPLEYRRRHAG